MTLFAFIKQHDTWKCLNFFFCYFSMQEEIQLPSHWVRTILSFVCQQNMECQLQVHPLRQLYDVLPWPLGTPSFHAVEKLSHKCKPHTGVLIVQLSPGFGVWEKDAAELLESLIRPPSITHGFCQCHTEQELPLPSFRSNEMLVAWRCYLLEWLV